jgi:hypothetical protein
MVNTLILDLVFILKIKNLSFNYLKLERKIQININHSKKLYVKKLHIFLNNIIKVNRIIIMA